MTTERCRMGCQYLHSTVGDDDIAQVAGLSQPSRTADRSPGRPAGHGRPVYEEQAPVQLGRQDDPAALSRRSIAGMGPRIR